MGKVLINVIDYATGYAYSFPLTDMMEAGALYAMNTVISNYGPPLEVISDNGQQFIGGTFTKLLPIARLNTRRRLRVTNGLCERYNGVIKFIRRHLLSDNPGARWEELLPTGVFNYRIRSNEYGYSPYYLVFGCDSAGA
jgi:transposase InsO family protein